MLTAEAVIKESLQALRREPGCAALAARLEEAHAEGDWTDARLGTVAAAEAAGATREDVL